AARRRERRARHGDHGRADDPAAPRHPHRGELQGPAIGSPPNKNSSSPRKRGPIPHRNVLLAPSPPRPPPPPTPPPTPPQPRFCWRAVPLAGTTLRLLEKESPHAAMARPVSHRADHQRLPRRV